jgi:LacI family transcriptional regulator
MTAPGLPSMKDIASSLGIHVSTVSLALRNDPRIPPGTRNRIADEAKRIGYSVNPLVSSLMSYRSRRTPPPYRMELACVCATQTKNEWLKMSEAYRRMWSGAGARAQQLGYHLNLYPREDHKLSPARFSDILAARNIHGILVAPMPVSDVQLTIDWTRFSVVELGYTLRETDFHKVVHDYFHGMLMALREIRKRSFNRVGLILPENVDDKVHHLWRAAYIDEQETRPRRHRLKPLIQPKIDQSGLTHWLRTQRPEVILTADYQRTRELLTALKYRVPDKLSVVSLGCYNQEPSVAGIYQGYESMGAIAVELLVALIQRGETGCPPRSMRTQVGGMWVDGATLGSAQPHSTI